MTTTQSSSPIPPAPDITWRQALNTLGLYIFLNFALSILGAILSLPFYAVIRSALPMPQNVTLVIPSFIEVAAQIFYNLAFAILTLLFQYGVIHFVATRTLGGQGTYRGLVHRLTQVLIVQTIVSGIIGLVIVFFLNPLMLNLPRENAQAIVNHATTVFVPGIVVMFAVSIWLFIWQWRRLNENYGLTSGRGCMVLTLSTILMFALNIALAIVFTAFP